MFSLEKPNYKLDKVDFNVDVPFNEKIKPPFENKSFFILLLESPEAVKHQFL